MSDSPYPALPSPRHIRLLVLHPGAGADPLTCSLTVASLDSALPPFEALSYAEHLHHPPSSSSSSSYSSSPPPTIRLSNAPRHHHHHHHDVDLPVSPALHALLLRLRRSRWWHASSLFARRGGRRVLWAPREVCVDAGDAAERSVQARLAGEVFARARGVVVWLGEETDEVRGVVAQVRRVRAGFPDGMPQEEEDEEKEEMERREKADGRAVLRMGGWWWGGAEKGLKRKYSAARLDELFAKEKMANDNAAARGRLAALGPQYARGFGGHGHDEVNHTHSHPHPNPHRNYRRHHRHDGPLSAQSLPQLANLMRSYAWFFSAWTPLELAASNTITANIMLGRNRLPLRTLVELLAHLSRRGLDVAALLAPPSCPDPLTACRAAHNLLLAWRLRDDDDAASSPGRGISSSSTRTLVELARLMAGPGGFTLCAHPADRMAALVGLATLPGGRGRGGEGRGREEGGGGRLATTEEAEKGLMRELLIDYAADEGELARRWAVWCVQVKGELEFLGLVEGPGEEENAQEGGERGGVLSAGGVGNVAHADELDVLGRRMSGLSQVTTTDASDDESSDGISIVAPSPTPSVRLLPSWVPSLSHFPPGSGLRSRLYRACGPGSAVSAVFSEEYGVLGLWATPVDEVVVVTRMTTPELLSATRTDRGAADPSEAGLPRLVAWLVECSAVALGEERWERKRRMRRMMMMQGSRRDMVGSAVVVGSRGKSTEGDVWAWGCGVEAELSDGGRGHLHHHEPIEEEDGEETADDELDVPPLLPSADVSTEERVLDDFFRVMTLDAQCLLGPEDKAVFTRGVEAVEAYLEAHEAPMMDAGEVERPDLRRVASEPEVAHLGQRDREREWHALSLDDGAPGPSSLRRAASSVEVRRAGARPGPTPSLVAVAEAAALEVERQQGSGCARADHPPSSSGSSSAASCDSTSTSSSVGTATTPTMSNLTSATTVTARSVPKMPSASAFANPTRMNTAEPPPVRSVVTGPKATAPTSPPPARLPAATQPSASARPPPPPASVPPTDPHFPPPLYPAPPSALPIPLPRLDARFIRLLLPAASLGRRLCATTAGRLGWFPAACRDGDRVVIPDGGRVPVALREERGPRGETRARMRCGVVGECYVQGVMMGEAVVVDAAAGGEGERVLVELV